MQSIRQITVDLQRNDVLVPIYAKQYDANTRVVELTVLDGEAAFTMPTNPVFMIGVRTASGVFFLYDQIVSAVASLGLTVRMNLDKWGSTGLSSATFTYNGTVWKRNGTTADLDDYGITVAGTPTNGAQIVISTENAVSNSANVVTFTIHPSAFISAGMASCELYIADGTDIISSVKLPLFVESAACPLDITPTEQTFVYLAAQIHAYVDEILAAHPEWTTTLADGAVSYAKLDAALKGKVDAFDALGLSVVDGMLCVTYSE